MRAFTKAMFGAAIGAAALIATSTASTAQGRTDVVVAAPWHVNGMDPASDGYTFQRMEVAETLVDAGIDGQLRPGLATEWQVGGDGLVWRFQLRDGVRFHDGTELSADAAVASLKRAVTQPGVLQNLPIAEIAADGDAVVIRLAEKFAALPAVLANYTALILAPASFDGDGKVVSVIGTGPFQVAQIDPPSSLSLKRFDGYWGEAAHLEAARYISTSRAETRALMAESGDADLVFTLDPAGYSRLSQLEPVEVKAVPIPRTIVLKLNLAHPALTEAEARQALSLAIDRDGIAAGILRFPDATASQLFPPALADWHDPTLTPLAYDPDTARQSLAALGWAPGEDGILVRDGMRFALTLRTFPNRPELPLIAAALQDQWRQIGVALDISVGNFSEIPSGHQDGSLDVALFARNYGLTPDPVVNAAEDFGAGGADWGAMNWDAPDVAEALAKARAESDPATRGPAIDLAVAAVHKDLPVVPIAWYTHTVAYPDALQGVIVDPLERNYELSKLRWAE
ncbi:ABC transporter substrate-binding protein [Pacificispira sp.]|uniref:ABC transporter substrate-binding protein n=1 Tax=Pacificispira sp. TaxID=2888761 RepID=UPI003BA864D7